MLVSERRRWIVEVGSGLLVMGEGSLPGICRRVRELADRRVSAHNGPSLSARRGGTGRKRVPEAGGGI